MPGDENLTLYRDLLNSWVELLRAMGAATEGLAGRTVPPPDGAERPRVADPQLVSLLTEMSLVLVTSGVRYWIGAAETFAKLLPSIDLGLGAAPGEDPARTATARAAMIEEFRTGLRSLTSLSYQEARRALAEFEALVQQVSPDPPAQATGEYWRRWTVKP